MLSPEPHMASTVLVLEVATPPIFSKKIKVTCGGEAWAV